MKTVGSILACVKAKFQQRLMYPANFFVSQLNLLAFQIAQPLFFLIIYGVSNGFPGWSVADALLLSGYVAFVDGIVAMFFGGITSEVPKRVKNGTFDVILLKPLHSLQYIAATTVDLDSAGRVLAGIITITYAGTLSGLPLLHYIFLAAYVPIAGAGLLGVRIVVSAMVLRFLEISRLTDIQQFAKDYAAYPKNVFPRLLRWSFWAVIPILGVAVLPVEIIRGVATPAQLLGVPVLLGWFFVSLVIWESSLKAYTSAGG